MIHSTRDDAKKKDIVDGTCDEGSLENQVWKEADGKGM